MKINIYSIIKPSKDEFDVLIKEFIKMSSKYAKVEVHYIFNKNIAKAQTILLENEHADNFMDSISLNKEMIKHIK